MPRLILIRFSSLGDCVLLCPLAEHLKQHGAEEVTVVTKTVYARLFAAATGVDRVVGFDPHTGVAGLFDIAGRFRDGGYRVIDAHNNWRSRILSWRLGGARARFRKHYRERLGLILFKRRVSLPSMLEKYAALAEPAGFPIARLSPGGIEVPKRRADAAARRVRPDRHRFVAMAPGARWPAKRWPVDRYVELARRLVRDRGIRVLLVGDEADRSVTSPISAGVGESCIDVTGTTDIIECAAHIKQCVGFVGNDSGLAHLAEAVGIPVVALFGPTVEPFGYYPALPGSKAVECALACRPCSRNGSRPCPKRTNECLTGIGVDDVERAVLDMLDGSGPQRIVIER